MSEMHIRATGKTEEGERSTDQRSKDRILQKRVPRTRSPRPSNSPNRARRHRHTGPDADERRAREDEEHEGDDAKRPAEAARVCEEVVDEEGEERAADSCSAEYY